MAVQFTETGAMVLPEKKFADYKADGHAWVTLANGEYYSDILPLACELYKPVLVMFGHLWSTQKPRQPVVTAMLWIAFISRLQAFIQTVAWAGL